MQKPNQVKMETTVKILAQPTSVKMITGETIIAYVLYAKIPEEPTQEDIDILDALDIENSMFSIIPSLVTKGNDGYEFRPWVDFTDLKVFRIERGDVLIAAHADKETTDQFDLYIAKKEIAIADVISRLFTQLGLTFEEESKHVDPMILSTTSQYLAELNNVYDVKH